MPALPPIRALKGQRIQFSGKMKFQIYGDRVLLAEVPEQKEINGIALPESRTRQYLHMQVVAVGDGRVRGGDIPVHRKMCVKPGDQVMVQLNPMMISGNQQKVGGVKYLTVNHHDIIARVEAGVFDLTLDTFHPVGRWVLVRVDAPDRVGLIHLPAQSPLRSSGEVKTFLAKLGDVATEELDQIPIGTQVMLEHNRVQPFSLNRVAYAYIDCASIAGALPESMDPGVTLVVPN